LFFERPESGERALLVHLNLSTEAEREDPREFEELVLSAGGDPVDYVFGQREAPHPRYFVGTGRIRATVESRTETEEGNPALARLRYRVEPGLATRYEIRGVPDKEARRVRRRLELNPEDTRALTLGGCNLIELGEKQEGIAWLERALEIDPQDLGVLHNAGCGLVAAGEIDRALDLFEERFAKGDVYLPWIENDSDFDPLREHPRFKAMVRT